MAGMSLLAALGLSFALAAPAELAWPRASLKPRTPTALAARIEAEKTRAASKKPLVAPSPPPRFAPRLRALRPDPPALVECTICPLPKQRPIAEYDTAAYADELLRLVGHFDEKRDHFTTSAAALDDDIAAAELHAPQKASQLRSKQGKLLGHATEASEQMVKLLKVLITSPRLPQQNTEEGLYLSVIELGRLGRAVEMQDAHQRLVREHPGSVYLKHLELAAAHRALASGRLAEARTHFETVLKGPPPELHANSLYALAWLQLQPDIGVPPRPELALTAFVRVIEATLAGPLTDDLTALRHAAQDGLVRAFADAGRPRQAVALFQRLGDLPHLAEQRAPELLEALALTYFTRGQHEQSAELYRDLFNKLYPEHPQRCTWQTSLLLTAVGTGDRDVQAREAQRLGELWRQWHAEQHHRQVDILRCQEDARTALSQLAMHWHDDADTTGDRTSHARAGQTYAAYLQLWPEGHASHAMRIYAAELQWSHAARLSRDPRTRDAARREFVAVHDTFTAILALEPDAPEAPELARAAMLAMRNALDHREQRPTRRGCTTDWRGQCP